MSSLDSPTVSVIMAMRNSGTTIGAAVRSIQMQTLKDWDMILIDDGSTDDSVRIVESFADARIRLICDKQHLGLAPRLNQAVALSRGEFIARMDADDISFPKRLELQVESLRRDPSLDVIGAAAVVFDNREEPIGILPLATEHDDIVKNPSDGFPLVHPTWCGRAAWFKKNPYDSGLMKAEDQDLLLRTFKSSRFGALKDVLLGYRQNDLQLKKLYGGRRAFMSALWKYGKTPGQRVPALIGIATHSVKSIIDIATFGFGLSRPAQKMRLQPVTASVAEEWRKVCVNLNSEIARCAE